MQTKTNKRNRGRELRQLGYSIKHIAKELGVAKSSVSVWVRDIQLTSLQRHILKERELLGGAKGRQASLRYWQAYRKSHPKDVKKPRWPNRDVESFFDSWSPDMAYVLGYFAADGNMHRNKRGACYIEFTSIDKDLIVMLSKMMKVSTKIKIRPPKGNCKEAYTIQIGSQKIFSRLLELGLTPVKSLSLQFPMVPKDLFFHFIRGYFDGDGCASFATYKRKDRHKPSTNLMFRLSSGSKEFLEQVQRRISYYSGIGKGSLHKHSTIYDLAYSTQDVIELFDFIYPTTKVPCLQRKRRVLEKGLKFFGVVAQRLERLPVEMQLLEETLG